MTTGSISSASSCSRRHRCRARITYEIYSEVTEMFVHDYSSTPLDTDGDGIGDSGMPVEVRANTTIGFVSGERFRSDEQPPQAGLQGPLLGRLQQRDFRQPTRICARTLSVSDQAPVRKHHSSDRLRRIRERIQSCRRRMGFTGLQPILDDGNRSSGIHAG